jgi:biotin transport system substrate-specific component
MNKSQTGTISANQFYIKHLVITGMFTAIISVLSVITIPTHPIPFTLSLFAIFLTGSLLPPKDAFLSVIIYILLGAFGVPVFSGFRGGFQVITGFTGGYLLSYPLMAFIIALFQKFSKKYKIFFVTIGMVIALILCYFLGTLWFSIASKTSFVSALSLCVAPFVLFDAVKIGIAVSFSVVLRKTIGKSLNDF